MKKNFRRVPEWILQSIENIEGDSVIVATVITVTANDFENPIYTEINFEINDGVLTFNDEFVPSQNKGSFSKKNVLGV